MTATTAEKKRAWAGPAILAHGFRPFFFGASVWASLAMALWVLMLSGVTTVPTAFDAVSWHAHEFLFGYLSAVMAGFLLTAVPNWTGRVPIVGWQLGALALLWLAGRVAVGVSDGVRPVFVAVVDLAFPTLFTIVIGREIVAGKNWRNLLVVGMLALFTFGNALFHWEAAQGDHAAQGAGLRMGVGAGIMMIAGIGGRIVPAFTRNWLVKQRDGQMPVAPMQGFDKVALLSLFVTLILWVFLPGNVVTGVAMLISGLLHAVRLSRWAGHRTLAEPLVTVLHVGYAFLPFGALALGVEILVPDILGIAAAQHLWMGGAIGLMTLAIMTRATLGHTGQALSAGAGTVAIYTALVLAVLTRVAAGTLPGAAAALHMVSGLTWLVAFAGFAVIYGRWLLRLPDAQGV